MSKRPQPTAPIYQLKVTLRHAKPAIWRRILVPGDFTLEWVHYVLQAAMGWTNSHLHQFECGGATISDPTFELDDWGVEIEDEGRVTLGQVLPAAKSKMRYEYDFGDSWEHDVVVEKVLLPEEGATYPICLKGARACPPEDCGGVWGYEEMLKAVADPEDDEHESWSEWLGEFDPEAFDLATVNKSLALMGHGARRRRR